MSILGEMAAYIVIVGCKMYYGFAMGVYVRKSGEAGVGSLGPYRIGTRFWVGSAMRGCALGDHRSLFLTSSVATVCRLFIAGVQIEQKPKRYIDDIVTMLMLLTD